MEIFQNEDINEENNDNQENEQQNPSNDNQDSDSEDNKDQESISEVLRGAIRRAEQIDPMKESLFLIQDENELALVHYKNEDINSEFLMMWRASVAGNNFDTLSAKSTMSKTIG